MPDREFVEAMRETVKIEHLEDVPDSVPMVVRPGEWEIECVDIEPFLPYPRRAKGMMELRTITDFCAYVHEHKRPGTVVLLDGHRLTCIFNHHHEEYVGGAGAAALDAPKVHTIPGWNDYRATFAPKFTRGWTAWTEFERKAMDQSSFAEFLEDRLGEIAEPDGATVLEAVRRLQIKVDVIYQSVTRTENDTINLVFKEELSHTGDLKLPASLLLVLTPFEGAPPEALEAALHVTKPNQQGEVRFSYRLGEKVQQILDDADSWMAETAAKDAGAPVLRGRLVE